MTVTTTTDVQHHFNIATHNGRITMRNPATGNHRTFQIRTQPADSEFAPGERVVALMNGSDNENSYQGFGFVKDNGWIILWKRYRQSGTYQAYTRMLREPAHYAEKHDIDYLYEGRCRVCNRTLTNPESIESGIGPVCAARG